MRHVELIGSSSFRFAAILIATIAIAYGSAGAVAFRSIGHDLHLRVEERTELMLERLEDRYEDGGETALIEAVKSAAAEADPEDRIIWLGRSDGQGIVGSQAGLASVVAGDVEGRSLGAEQGDLYRVGVRNLGGLHLAVASSYEEIDEIMEHVISVFAWASVFVLAVAGGTAMALARKGQRRIDAIVQTIQSVSRGAMTARVPVDGARDDLGHLSTGINEALDKLETTVGAIRQVTTDIAHDLRTPINRIAIMLEKVRDPDSDENVRAQALDRADEELRRVTATFDAMLRIAQIEAGARKSRFAPVLLESCVSVVYQAYAPVAAEKGQHLELGSLPGPERAIDGDADLLTQLLANLIENSIRHCGAGTVIRIEGGIRDDGVVWLRVSDTGPGISESERSNVLKRFYRVEKHRGGSGTGLGLALVKAIADLHDATLTLHDNAPGLRVDLIFRPPRAMER